MPFRYSIGSGKNEQEEIRENTDSFRNMNLMFHTLILGRTGTGKSNFIKNLASHIGKMDGANIILIDFHGILAGEVIEICSHMDLIYLSPKTNSGNRKIKINVLKGARDSSISLYLLSQIFSKENSLSGGTWGPRLQTIFTAVLREYVRQYSEPTLREFLQLITDRKMMIELRKNSSSDASTILLNLTKNWDSWIEYSMSTVNKIFPIISDENISSFISSREESVEIVNELKQGGKLIIVDVSKTRFSIQQARIISSMILNRIWNDILQNGNIQKTMVIVDEAQNLNSSIVSEILSEGRKFGLFITLASQFLGQYDQNLRESLISNCGKIFCFNMSEEDSREIISLISDRRLREKTLKSIMLGPLHNVTMIDLISRRGISASSFKPPLIEIFPEDNRIRGRIELSIEKYGLPEERREMGNFEPDSPYPETQTHEKIMERFLEYLKRKNIKYLTEERINGLRPDIIFFPQGNPVIVEIEVSDIMRFERVLKKACDYHRSDLIFLCPRDGATELYRSFLDSEKVLKILSKMDSMGENSFFNPERITLVEERDERYYYVEASGLKRWSADFYQGTFKKSFSHLEEGLNMPVANILRMMENERRYYIHITGFPFQGSSNGERILITDLYK